MKRENISTSKFYTQCILFLILRTFLQTQIMRIITEVCADSINSAIAAQEGGAERIELCQALSEDGLTPSPALTIYCKENLDLQVMVLIRPRPGDFCYNDAEFEVIKNDVLFCKEAGVEGVVVGFLDKFNRVEKERLKEIVSLADDMEVTFHKAFDVSENLEESLETIIECGCDRILTSGGCKTAYEGRFVIGNLIEKAAGRIKILAGGGVNPENVIDIIKDSRCTEVHFSAKAKVTGANGSTHFESSAQTIKTITSKTSEL